MNKKSEYFITELNDENNEERILNAVKELVRLKVNFGIHEIIEGQWILRSRFEMYDWNPKEIKELSYFDQFENVEKKRANIDKSPAFYGCAIPYPLRPESKESIEICAREASKIYGSKLFLKEFGVVSKWRFTKKMKFLTMCNYDFGPNANPEIVKMKNNIRDHLQRHSDNFDFEWSINNHISKLFAKRYPEENQNNYKVTSLFSNEMYKYFDGILYPSVMGRGSVFNIAIKPKSCKNLKIEMMYKCRNTFHPITNRLDHMWIKSTKSFDQHKILKWENVNNKLIINW